MNDERNREYFMNTFSEIKAPSALVGKVLNMTANNEKKARPKVVKKVVIIAAALTLVLAATLVTVATAKFNFFYEIPFGNQTLSIFGYDPETGESEVIAVGKLPDEKFIFDLPALIDTDKLPIPEGFKPSVIHEIGDNGELVIAEPRYFKHTVNLHYSGTFTEIDKNGEECIYGKNLYIHIDERYKNTRITVMHDGEMNVVQLGDFEVYYYYDEDMDTINYATLGKKYSIRIENISHNMNENGILTLDEISAILEAIDSMIYPN